MKGLIITVIIITLFILVGLGVSTLIGSNLGRQTVAARELGFKEGYAQGYEEGFLQGSKIGYQEGSKTGYIQARGEDNDGSDEDGFHFVYNPTYAEVQEILALGKAGSAEEILEYADNNGIRAACARVELTSEEDVSFSWLVAFETVDRGLIVIEPWSYRKVKVEVGKSYSELNGLSPYPLDDTITKITIIW